MERTGETHESKQSFLISFKEKRQDCNPVVVVGNLNCSLSKQLDVDCHLFPFLSVFLDADSNPRSHKHLSEARRES